jgi:hypothetical protein
LFAAKLRARPETKPLAREKPEEFIVRRNIAHYRDLLTAGKLAQRRSTDALTLFSPAMSAIGGQLNRSTQHLRNAY